MQVLESKTPTLDGADVSALLNALQKYANQKNFSELRNRLVQWATDHQQVMRAQELQRMLEQWARKAASEQAVTTVALDVEKCMPMLTKLPAKVPDYLQTTLCQCVPLLMRQIATQAH